MNGFIKVRDASTGRFLYVNIKYICLMFEADDDSNKTIMMMTHKFDGIYNRRVLNERVEDVYDAIAGCFGKDSLE